MQLTDMIASGMGFRELVWLAMIGAALAQSPEASISGVVTDTQGAVIAGAKGEARNSSTGVITAAESNPSGFYALRFLPNGQDQVTVDHPGFLRHVLQRTALTT